MVRTGRSEWLVQATRVAATAVRLLGPVLIPSWRFFDVVAPSPRLEYAIADSAGAAFAQWHVLPLLVANVSLRQMLWRLFYNAQRNDALFLVSCCERVLEQADTAVDTAPHDDSSLAARAQQEILRRATRHAQQTGRLPTHGAVQHWLRFRILEVRRVEDDLHTELAFSSAAFAVADVTAHLSAARRSQ